MIEFPMMLMIGSAGKNSGKTELACRLIEKFSKKQPIVGVKITVIHGDDPDCLQEEKKEHNYHIQEEKGNHLQKDTTRLLNAGAEKVYWLRTRRQCLEEGFLALSKLIQNKFVICESNSLRLFVEPGLFLVVRKEKEFQIKPSCQKVLSYADRIVLSHPPHFDLNLENIKILQNTWMIRWKASAIILAGGNSRRMGQDKSLLPIDGKPMIQYIQEQLTPVFSEVMIGANAPEKYHFCKSRIIPDEFEGQGALLGMYSCLKASQNEINFITACDTPIIDYHILKELMRNAENFDAIVPIIHKDRYEPLFAVYHKNMERCILEKIKKGKLRITNVFTGRKVRYLTIRNHDCCKNLNTQEDYDEFLKIHTTRASQ